MSTPQLLWHGGGNANGKPDPVYSVDYLPSKSSFTGSTDDSYILCTTGIDANVPPKGSVRVSFDISTWNLSLLSEFTCNNFNSSGKYHPNKSRKSS